MKMGTSQGRSVSADGWFRIHFDWGILRKPIEMSEVALKPLSDCQVALTSVVLNVDAPLKR